MARRAVLGLLIVACVASASSARAQVQNGLAHCAWLKLKAKASGYELANGDAGLGKKRGPSATCYMQLVYSAPGDGTPNGSYNAPLVCQTDFQTWEMTSAFEGYSGKKLGDGNVTSLDDYMTFANPAGDSIEGFASARLVISADKTGMVFKKATFVSLSGELGENAWFNDTAVYLFGSFTVKGSSVPAAKVPAEVQAAVAGNGCAP